MCDSRLDMWKPVYLKINFATGMGYSDFTGANSLCLRE